MEDLEGRIEPGKLELENIDVMIERTVKSVCSHSAERAKTRYNEIIELAKSSRDNELADMLDTLFYDAIDYTEKVALWEKRKKEARIRYDNEPEKYQELVTNMDASRRCKHNSIIAQVNMINRALLTIYKFDPKHPEAGIVEGAYRWIFEDKDQHPDRETVQNWTSYVTKGYFESRSQK